MTSISPTRLKIIVLYILLGAGGLWHVLGFFQSTMEVLAAPMIIAIGAWLVWESTSKENSPKFILWCALVGCISFIVEMLGVKTGVIFGVYNYGSILQPQLLHTPLAIGFAWVGMLLSSAAMTERTLRERRVHPLIQSGLIALFMVIFDFAMEPAAVKLGYWQWSGGVIPLQNYAAWFGISYVFAYVGLRSSALPARFPSVAIHAYFGQLLYFILIYFSHQTP